MPAIDRDRLPGLVLIVLGLAVVAAVLVAFPHAGQQAHHHEVRPVDEGEVNDTYYSPVMEYEELSPAGKDAFRAALESDDGHHVVYGEAAAPDDWRYLTDTGPYYAYVHYDGSYYGLEAWGGSFEELGGYGVALLGLLGVSMAAAGGWRYLGLHAELDDGGPVAAVVAGTVVFLALGVDFALGTELLPLAVGGLILVTVAVATTLVLGGADGR